MSDIDVRIKELSKKKHLTEEEKRFVKNYYRSIFFGGISQISELKVNEVGANEKR